MADYSELKRLAKAATPGPWSTEANELYWLEDGYTKHLMETFDGSDICHEAEHPANLKFIAAANPAVVLALITENEKLAEDYDKAWRHDLNGKNNVEAMVGELAGAQAMLETAYSERDQLKAEVEALRRDAERYRWITDGSRGDWCWSNVLSEEHRELSDSLDGAVDAAMSKESGHD